MREPPNASLVTVPIAWIQTDHEDAVDLARDLDRRLGEIGHAPGALAQADEALRDLIEHTREHFAREEDAMRRHDFPGTELHRSAHAVMVARTVDAIARWRKTHDADTLAAWIRNDYLPWLEEHVRTVDVVAALWLEANGE
jgi:hemerythrin